MPIFLGHEVEGELVLLDGSVLTVDSSRSFAAVKGHLVNACRNDRTIGLAIMNLQRFVLKEYPQWAFVVSTPSFKNTGDPRETSIFSAKTYT